jgi:hypothetical protein
MVAPTNPNPGTIPARTHKVKRCLVYAQNMFEFDRQMFSLVLVAASNPT